MRLYIIGSLRNPAVPELARVLRDLGHVVFDDWYAAGPEADDFWQKYEKARGHSFQEALDGHAARHVYEYDKEHLDAAEGVIMPMPAGKSSHLELGYMVGTGKPAWILMDKEPERYDVMYRFATKVCSSLAELVASIKEVEGGSWI